MNYWYLTFRSLWQKQQLRRYRSIVARANKLEPRLTVLSNEQLSEEVRRLHNAAQDRSRMADIIPQALALGREFSQRTLKMRHYDVQLIGTLVLYEGHIAEMATGEGKTLMAPLAAFLHKLGRIDRCTHIATANEYLAARDAQWMFPLCQALQMTVGLIVPGQNTASRAEAYQKDIVYTAAKEIVFDSLRDPIRKKKMSPAEAILRPQKGLTMNPVYDFVIIDEIDSVLIDQARSPIAIGADSASSTQLELYRQAATIAGKLNRGSHYRLMYDDSQVQLKDEGKAQARKLAGGILRMVPPGQKWERYITCALAARHIYKKDDHYVVRDNKIVLIDENTGRLMPGRQLPDGIHQALEIQNGIIPTAELKGTHQTTYQTFFRKYKKRAGMTGTAEMDAFEFSNVYDLAVVPIPTNKPSQRKVWPDQIFRTKQAKYQAVLDEIEKIHQTGRPILIGTGSVQISEELSNMLQQKELPHEVLNAKNHAREAAIIAEAGQPSRITIITNMAGRGVDIVLGAGIADKGGLGLIGTDRSIIRRLDEQLIGRVGRQGDPGDCKFFLSLKDDILRYADRKKVFRTRLKTRGNNHLPIDIPRAAKLFALAQERIKNHAGKTRQQVYQGEKYREELRKKGLWQDWMDAR